MNIIMFYILAAIILVFSVLSVTSRKILRAATYLLFVLIATSGLYFLLQVNFLAAVQLMLYAGGITVLIVFSILLTHNIEFRFDTIELKKQIATLLVAVLGAILCITTIVQFNFDKIASPVTKAPHIKDFGRAFLSYGEKGYVLPFEVITVLLLAAMVAAIMIAKKK